MKNLSLWLGVLLVLAFSGCDSESAPENNGNNLNNVNNTNNINNINNINNLNNLNNVNNINNLNNTNNTTIIPPNQNKTEAQALAQLFPGTTAEVATSAGGTYYLLKNDVQEIVGYGLVNANYGFNGEVKTLVGISALGVLAGLETITQHESWWYYVPESFFTQFTGLLMENITRLPGYDKNCSPGCGSVYDAVGVDGISGATYTSDAMIKNAMDGFLHWDEILTAL